CGRVPNQRRERELRLPQGANCPCGSGRKYRKCHGA
ncbi:MAG: hypothetical protein HC889_16170, partial [Synechococcaceae cyanobacterium SM1_2_3]|nr:hypothetical protein [Synechococcaceae cyanobacterium SM1_2_3]